MLFRGPIIFNLILRGLKSMRGGKRKGRNNMKILTAIIIAAIILAVIVTGLTVGKQLQTKIIATHQQILNDIRQN